MLKNYLRIAYRSLMKMKVFSFINIFGLGIGMAAFLFIIHYVRFEKSYEDYNVNADNVYRVTLDIYNGAEYVMTDCETQAPLGPMLKERMPEVVDFVRMYGKDGLEEIRIDDQKFLEGNIYFADPSAIEIFSLDVLKGNRTALNAPYSAVITSSIAKKFFGDKDPVGQSIQIRKDLYKVTALISDSPAGTHLKTSILLSHSTLTKENKWYSEQNWSNNNEFTYLLMVPGSDLAVFNDKLAKLSSELKDKIDHSRFTAEPIKDIHLYSNKSFEPEVNGSIKIVYFMLIIAVFIIVIAWVNYVNLSTARAMDRAREVGIRKVMGSLKTQLIFQFLSESVIVNVLAALLALFLFKAFLPVFRLLVGLSLPFSFSQDPIFWYLFGGLIFLGSVLSGVYPAFMLSSFQPAAVLKGKFQSSSHGQNLRKGLVVFQFGATVILIICLGVVYQQIGFLRSFDLGMNIDQTLVVRSPRISGVDSVYKSSFQNLKTELLRNPAIEGIGQSDAFPGSNIHELSTTRISRLGKMPVKGTTSTIFLKRMRTLSRRCK
ncbi:MAG: ABC transporter permease [Bacteroidota bacterium]